jgi:hypothetical protein
VLTIKQATPRTMAITNKAVALWLVAKSAISVAIPQNNQKIGLSGIVIFFITIWIMFKFYLALPYSIARVNAYIIPNTIINIDTICAFTLLIALDSINNATQSRPINPTVHTNFINFNQSFFLCNNSVFPILSINTPLTILSLT